MFDASNDPIAAADAANARMGAAQRDLLGSIAEVDRTEAWQGDGARDVAHWVGMRYGISAWKAHRWVAAAHALAELPTTAEALGSGRLGIDKVVELTRLATPKTERGLIWWATTVSCGAIRRRADLMSRLDLHEDRDADRDRSLSWWYSEEGRRWNLQAELPAAAGAVVVRAIERMATPCPSCPTRTSPSTIPRDAPTPSWRSVPRGSPRIPTPIVRRSWCTRSSTAWRTAPEAPSWKAAR